MCEIAYPWLRGSEAAVKAPFFIIGDSTFIHKKNEIQLSRSMWLDFGCITGRRRRLTCSAMWYDLEPPSPISKMKARIFMAWRQMDLQEMLIAVIIRDTFSWLF